MDSRQGEEDEDDEGRKRQRLGATRTTAARMLDNHASESEGDEPRPPSKKRKKGSTSSEESEEEEVITLKRKPSALRKLLNGSTRSKKKRVRSDTEPPADAPATRDERVNERVNSHERVDEKVDSQVPASSTVGELPDEELTAKELAALQQLMSLAENIPRLDVLRALRVVDFSLVKAVMLLGLVCETHTFQDVVIDALITDALSEEEQAKLEQYPSLSWCTDRVGAFRALCVFDDTYCADLLLQLAYFEYEPDRPHAYRYLLDTFDEEKKAAVEQVVSLAGNVDYLHAIWALSILDYDVIKAAMLLALIRSQDSASQDSASQDSASQDSASQDSASQDSASHEGNTV